MVKFGNPVLLWPPALVASALACIQRLQPPQLPAAVYNPIVKLLASVGLYHLLHDGLYRGVLPFLRIYALPAVTNARLGLYERYGRSANGQETGRSWACITGSTSGIGLAFAKELAVAGFNVVLFGRDQDKLDEAGSAVWAHLAKEGTEQHLSDFVLQKVAHGPLHKTKGSTDFAWFRDHVWNNHGFDKLDIAVFVNNAGCITTGPFSSMDAENMEEMLDVNCGTLLYLTKLAYDQMGKRKAEGAHVPRSALICVGSRGGWCLSPGAAVYGASKAFVEHLCRSLAVEGQDAAAPVDVMVVRPGIVSTPMTGNMEAGSWWDWLHTRVITPKQCAQAVLGQLAAGLSSSGGPGGRHTVSSGHWMHALDALYCGAIQCLSPGVFGQLRWAHYKSFPKLEKK